MLPNNQMERENRVNSKRKTYTLPWSIRPQKLEGAVL